MKTIAIMNYKGGVGKTVTTINFAAELAAAGKSVIVMDADGQCNLSDIFRADTLHGGTTYEVLTGETGCCWDELVQDTPVEGRENRSGQRGAAKGGYCRPDRRAAGEKRHPRFLPCGGRG